MNEEWMKQFLPAILATECSACGEKPLRKCRGLRSALTGADFCILRIRKALKMSGARPDFTVSSDIGLIPTKTVGSIDEVVEHLSRYRVFARGVPKGFLAGRLRKAEIIKHWGVFPAGESVDVTISYRKVEVKDEEDSD